MWESPINIMEIQEPIIEQFIKEREEMVLKQIWKIGIDVNKEELIKALQYDRGQYEKGYSDGYAKGIDEFASKMKWEYENSTGVPKKEIEFAKAVIDMVADKMKGGAVDG